MARTYTYTDSKPFVAQPDTLEYDMGRDIDWDNNGGATTVPAGTVMVIIAASDKMCPWATRPGAETAVGILAAGADQNDRSGTPGHALIVGGNIFENLVTTYPHASWATIKTELDAAGHWVWQTYGDNRVV